MSIFRLRIRGRLYSGFGALVLLGGGLAGFAVWQLWAIDAQVDAMKVQSENAIRIGEITTELQTIGRSMQRYALDQNEASLAEAEKRLTRVKELLEQAARTTTSKERRAVYGDAAKEVVELNTTRAALGDATKPMLAGRDMLLTNGDKLAAEAPKFVEATAGTPFALGAALLESEVPLMRVANWRLLATREPAGVTAFKTNDAAVQIAELEKAKLPSDLAIMLLTIKADVTGNSDAFAHTSMNLPAGDQLYSMSIAPAIERLIEKMNGAKGSIGQHFLRATHEARDQIIGAVTTERIAAGAGTLFGLLIAFLIARGITKPLGELVKDADRRARWS